MKLTKVQKKMKELNIKFEYDELPANYTTVATGDITFWDKDGERYTLGEHTGSGKSSTVQGIMVNGKDFKGDWWNQTQIVEWLEDNKDRF